MINSILSNPIALVFLSYTVGALLTELIKKIGLINLFENKNYISDLLTKKLRVLHFGWLIRNSFMGMFNKKLVLGTKADKETLQTLIKEMTYAETGHLIGFVVLLILNFVLPFLGYSVTYSIILFLVNVVFNLYLVFLQQYNKRRIFKVLARMR